MYVTLILTRNDFAYHLRFFELLQGPKKKKKKGLRTLNILQSKLVKAGWRAGILEDCIKSLSLNG